MGLEGAGESPRWLGEPTSAVDEAYANATELAPDETRFLREWGRFNKRGSLALLEWQGRQLAELQVPEHLYGRGVLGEAEFAKQSATLDALRRSADELKHALSVAIDKRDPHVRHLMEDLDAARTRMEGPGGERVDEGLEVARELTQAFLAGAGRQTVASGDSASVGKVPAVARTLADLNTQYLAWLRPTL